MRIDPHVHCRDGNESHKETIAHVFKLCDAQGVDVVFDMPNTDPPILLPQDVEARLKLVPPGVRERYRLYIGVSTRPEQLQSAVAMARDCEHVAGLKLYAGESVGSLAVVGESEQKRVYEQLAAAGYTGVLAVHCEKSSLLVKAFNPEDPVSHSVARPVESETESMADQIQFAETSGFKGVLHICHVSAAASIALVNAARNKIKITCGVTPHHLLWTSDRCRRPDGLLYKVNPPLRSRSDMLALRDALKDGLIDWIETDHAPHALSEKLYPPYCSGYPSLCLYRMLLEKSLPEWGLGRKQIDSLTHSNIASVFAD